MIDGVSVHESERLARCVFCGQELTPAEQAYPAHDEDGEPVLACTACECDELHFPCAQCDDCGLAEEQHRLLLVFDDEQAVPQGTYAIVRFPYYSAGLLGASWLHARALTYLGPLPDDVDLEAQAYPCGHLCGACQRAYRPDRRWALATVWWG